MHHIKIKPLSVNGAWRGRRSKTYDYMNYEKALFKMLPKIEIPDGKLHLTLTFGFSSKGSDLDNPAKPFIDILQKVYLFNDNRIYYLEVYKIDVQKGEEFISFSLDTCKL